MTFIISVDGTTNMVEMLEVVAEDAYMAVLELAISRSVSNFCHQLLVYNATILG